MSFLSGLTGMFGGSTDTSKNISGTSNTTQTAQQQQTGATTGQQNVAREYDPQIGAAFSEMPALYQSANEMLTSGAEPTDWSQIQPLLSPYATSQAEATLAAEAPSEAMQRSSVLNANASNPYSSAGGGGSASDQLFEASLAGLHGQQVSGIFNQDYSQALQAAQADAMRRLQSGQGLVSSAGSQIGLVPSLVTAGNVGTTSAGTSQQAGTSGSTSNTNYNSSEQDVAQQNPSVASTLGGVASLAGDFMMLKRGGVARPRFAPGGVAQPYYVPGMVTAGGMPAASPPWSQAQPSLPPAPVAAGSALNPPAPMLPPFGGDRPPQQPQSGPLSMLTSPQAINQTPTQATNQTPAPAGAPAAPAAPQSATLPPGPAVAPAANNPGAGTPVGTMFRPAPAAGQPVAGPAPAPATSILPFNGSQPATGTVTNAPSGAAPAPSFTNQSPQAPMPAGLVAPSNASGQITPYTGKVAAAGSPQATFAHGGAVEDHHRFAEKVQHAFHAFHAMRKHAQDPNEHRQHFDAGGVGGGDVGLGSWAPSITQDSIQGYDPGGDAIVNQALAASQSQPSSGGPNFLQRLGSSLTNTAANVAKSTPAATAKDSGSGSDGANRGIPTTNSAATALGLAMSHQPAAPQFAAYGGTIHADEHGATPPEDGRLHYDGAGVVPPSDTASAPSINAGLPSAPQYPGDPTPGQQTLSAYGYPKWSPWEKLSYGLKTMDPGNAAFKESPFAGFARAQLLDKENQAKAAGFLADHDKLTGVTATNQPTMESGIATGNIPQPGGGTAPSIAKQEMPSMNALRSAQALSAGPSGQTYTEGSKKAQDILFSRLQSIQTMEAGAMFMPAGAPRPNFDAQRASAIADYNTELNRLRQQFAHPQAQGAPTPPDNIVRRRSVDDLGGGTTGAP